MTAALICPIYCSDPSLASQSQLLATQLRQKIISDPTFFDNYLTLNQDGLGICCKLDKHSVRYQVDFISGKNAHRRQQGGGYNQLIAKACGVKANSPLKILDLTAGFAKDAYVLACLGAKVTMLEKNPFVCALLEDGLKRLHEQSLTLDLSLKLIHADACEYLKDFRQFFDVIYLDPMFDEKDYGAQVKKDLQILRKIVNVNEESEHLFNHALNTKTKRIVVKRHRHAQPISEAPIHHQILGKSTRYDVYMNL